MPPTSEISVTPSGLKIVYYDKSHRYKLGKDDSKPEFVPSVSTILDKSLPKNLTGWAEKLTAEGICQLAQLKPIDRLGPVTILKEMHAHGLRYYQARDRAALRGTSVHKAFEDLADGKVPNLRDYPVEERGYVQGIARWWTEYDPDVVHNELMVASWTYQFAGRMDLLARLDTDLLVIDLKTSKAVRESHHFQTAGYRIGVEESGYGKPDAGYVLRVGEDGTFEFVKSHATEGQFLALHRSMLAQRDFQRTAKVYEKEKAA